MATSGWTVEQAQRRIDGYAADGLSWDEFGAAVIEVLADVVPHDAACVATVDPNSGLFTSLVRREIDESKDELFMEIELTQPDPITLTTLAATADGVGILADHLDGDPRSNARCRDLLGPFFDLEHELRGVARVRGRMWGAAALYRAPTLPGASRRTRPRPRPPPLRPPWPSGCGVACWPRRATLTTGRRPSSIRPTGRP